MALVLTLMAVSFMVAITVQLFSSVNQQIQAAVGLRDAVMLDAVTRSGLSIARAALLADQRENTFDSPHDSWNTLDPELLGSLAGPAALEVSVRDLSGLLQVNALVAPEQTQGRPGQKNKKPGGKNVKQISQEELQRELWKRFLTSGRFAVEDEQQALDLVAALQDWIDKDDRDRPNGAETAYYQGREPGYDARNGPILFKEELLRIRGMTPELFYGNEEYAALADFITVVGTDGRININAAPPEILLALHRDMTPEIVQDLIDFRSDEDNRDALARDQWFTGILAGAGITFSTNDAKLITVTSSAFEITSRAGYSDMVRVGRGILQRNKDETQTLLFWDVR